MTLGGADSGLSPLACASVLPGQWLYLGRGNRPAGHGKEKVYGRFRNGAPSSGAFPANLSEDDIARKMPLTCLSSYPLRDDRSDELGLWRADGDV
jgi:hypothetical protein